MSAPSNQEIASNLALWREYVDPNGLYDDEEFGRLTPEKAARIMWECGFSDECPDCDGSGRTLCSNCDSTGEGLWDGARCNVCGGHGDRPCETCEQADDYDDYSHDYEGYDVR